MIMPIFIKTFVNSVDQQQDDTDLQNFNDLFDYFAYATKNNDEVVIGKTGQPEIIEKTEIGIGDFKARANDKANWYRENVDHRPVTLQGFDFADIYHIANKKTGFGGAFGEVQRSKKFNWPQPVIAAHYELTIDGQNGSVKLKDANQNNIYLDLMPKDVLENYVFLPSNIQAATTNRMQDMEYAIFLLQEMDLDSNGRVSHLEFAKCIAKHEGPYKHGAEVYLARHPDE